MVDSSTLITAAGLIFFVAGAAFSWASVLQLVAVNAEHRIPYRGVPTVLPGRAIVMRMLGIACAMLGAVLVAAPFGLWGLLGVALALFPPTIRIWWHNRNLKARQ